MSAPNASPDQAPTRAPRGGLLALLAILGCVLLLAAYPRGARTLRHEWSTAASWPGGPPAGTEASAFFSRDPDGLYHMRRVERAFREGLPLAERDPFLAFPEGAGPTASGGTPIPWPPYYDWALYAAAKPFAPADEVLRHRFLEVFVASVPFVLGLATALLVTLIAWWLGGAAAALVAGAQFAFTRGAYNYAQLGVGDHHAWIALLELLLWAGLSLAFARGALQRARAGALWGAALGGIAGLALGSWVAALVHVVIVDVLLGSLVVVHARRELPGLGALGAAFHATALATLAPAVLASPWKAETPWITVNLSWFHPAYLAFGLAVFVPLLAGRRVLASGTRAARFYPAVVALALLCVGVLGVAFGIGPAAGLGEAFAWASRENEFMGVVRESQPLFGGGQGAAVFVDALGLLGFLAPFAWLALARSAWRDERLELAPWLVAFPVLALQAWGQVRFTNALAGPLAVLLGLAAAGLLARWRWRAWIWVPTALALVLAAHYRAWSDEQSALRVGYDAPETFWGPPVQDFVLGERMLFEWLRARRDWGTGAEVPDQAVLAHWDDGHAIEWVAGWPSVATNFGSYVGEASYAAPPRFFLAASEAAGAGILAERQVRYVVITRDFWRNMTTMVRVAGLDAAEFFPASGGISPRAFQTLGAQLVPVVTARDRTETVTTHAFETLRLVHVSPCFELRQPDPRTGTPMRAGWIWERVAGAVVELRGEPGTELELELAVDYPPASTTLQVRVRTVADSEGRARVRLPYATQSKDGTPNGDGVARGRWRFVFGEREGEFALSEGAVRSGATVEL